MISRAVESTPPRRTQAARREATRSALLTAAAECLAEEGYARTTVRRIAERAGVTVGALQHHFSTRAALLGEVRRHVGRKIAAEMLEERAAGITSLQARAQHELDRWWDLLRGPWFAVIAELLVAARTDSELRAELLEAERDGTRPAALAAAVYPELSERPGFAEVIARGQASMLGLAMLRFVDETQAEEAWPTMRAQLLAEGSRLVDEGGGFSLSELTRSIGAVVL